jgi:hypothetical protein
VEPMGRQMYRQFTFTSLGEIRLKKLGTYANRGLTRI